MYSLATIMMLLKIFLNSYIHHSSSVFNGSTVKGLQSKTDWFCALQLRQRRKTKKAMALAWASHWGYPTSANTGVEVSTARRLTIRSPLWIPWGSLGGWNNQRMKTLHIRTSLFQNHWYNESTHVLIGPLNPREHTCTVLFRHSHSGMGTAFRRKETIYH